MAIDSYSPCPCGSGKKLKFCCVDLTNELEKIQRMLDGQQRHAALDHIEKLLVQHPGRAALLAYKVTLQSELGMVEQARETIREFVALHPTNPVALANQALVKAGDEGAAVGVEILQQSLAASGQEIALPVYEAIGALAQVLLLEGHFLAARGHLMLQLRLSSRDEEALTLLGRVAQSPQIPLLIKEDLRLLDPPPDAPWRAEFNAAIEFAHNVGWREAERRFATLAQRVDNAPAIWQNLAVVRGWLANDLGAVEALRKLSALTAPREEAVEAEALAQLLDPATADDAVDEVRVTYTIADVDALLERIASNPRAMRLTPDALPRVEGQVPPRAGYWLLDQPMPTTGADIKLEGVPSVIGRLVVYGRETDREPRAEVEGLRRDLEAVRATITELAGGALGAAGDEEVIDHVPTSQLTLSWNWRLPEDTPREHVHQLLVRKRRDTLLNRWPKSPQQLFGGKTPDEVAGDASQRIKLQAAILLIELAMDFTSTPGLVNELRARLGLPTLQEIDPTGVDMNRLPLVRLARVQVDKLSDEDVAVQYQRAQFNGARAAVRRLATELVARPSLDGKVDKSVVYGSLAATEEDPGRAIEHLTKARAVAQAAGKSCARWDIAEFAQRLRRGDEREASELLRHIQTRHGSEPGVAEVLMQMLYEAGIVGPDGRPTAATAAAAPPGIMVPGAAAQPAGALWTPGAEPAASGAKKSAIWTPGMD